MKIIFLYPDSCEYAYPKYLDKNLDFDLFDQEIMCYTDLEVRYLQGMHELGHECTLLYPRRFRMKVKSFIHRGGYKIIRFPVNFFNGNMGKEYSFKMLRFLKKEKPDLVHFQGIYGAGKFFFIRFFIVTVLYCKWNKIPIFGWYHIGLNNQGKRERNLSKFSLFKWFFHQLRTKPIDLCNGITSINHSELFRLFDSKHPEYYGYSFKQKNYKLTPNTVNRKLFYPVAKDLAFEKTGLDKSKRYLIMVSRLFEQKGLHLILQVFPDLILKYPNIHLLVVGEFIEEALEYKIRIENYIQTNSLEKYVTFLGRIEHHQGLVYYLNVSEVFVLPTYKDSFAAVNIEAIACGIPVISSDTEEIPYYLNDGVGILIPPRDEQALGIAIDKVLSGEFKPDPIKQQEIVNRYDYLSAAKSLIDWYKEVLKK